MIKYWTTVLFVLISFQWLQAQETVKVRFYVKGGQTYFLKIDGKLLPESNIQYISPGEHTIEIWSPMHSLYQGTIKVPQKDSSSYYQELNKSPEYITYLNLMDGYKRKVFAGKTAPLLAVISGSVFTPILYYSRRKWNEELVIARFKSEYLSGNPGAEADIQRRYVATNVLFFASASMTLGGLTSYFLLKPWLERQSKPTFSQENPFTLERFEIGYRPDLNVTHLGLTLRF